MEIIIKYRDPNQEPIRKHQHTSGKARKDKSKPIMCEICGEQIPETEIKTQRKNRKFHKACNPNKHTSRSGKAIIPWGSIRGEKFIAAFDKQFNLKPIEVK